MEVIVSANFFKFFFVEVSVSCLDLFQSMLTKTMFTSAVLCSNEPVPGLVAALDLEGDHTDTIVA